MIYGTREEYPHYLKPSGKKWRFSELLERMRSGAERIANSDVWLADCPFHEYSRVSYITFAVIEGDGDGFRFECKYCINERLGSMEALHEAVTRWLNDTIEIPEDFGSHFNPYDAASEAPKLTYLPDTEGNPLLYKGAVNIVYGKPATLKSWLLLSLVTQHDVRYWDFENGSGTLAERLRSLRVPYEQAQNFTSPAFKESVSKRVEEYIEQKAEIVCIDGFSGLAQVMEVNVDSNQEVMGIYAKVFNPLREAGITVVVLDHLPKEGASDDYPIGAQAKKAQADLTLLVKNESRDEHVSLYVTKDRHGSVLDRAEPGAIPRRLGSMQLHTVDEDFVEFEIRPVYSANRGGQQLSTEDANLESSIYDLIQRNPACSKSEIERGVPGKTERKRKALENLVEMGYVQAQRVGTSITHTVLKPLDLEWEPIS